MKPFYKRPVSIFLIGALIVMIGAVIKIQWGTSTLATILLAAGMLISAIGVILLLWFLIAKKKL